MICRRLAFALIALAVLAAPARAAEPLVVGVPMPLTGTLAQAGQEILAGERYAADQANAKGGVLGRPITLDVQDTQSEPNTAAAVAAKMATQDHVYAFVGGFGSTGDFAILSAVKRYQPIFIHPASSSVKLETTFGKEPWYFHVYIWDYHRQIFATDFMRSIGAKRIALAHEDGLFGSDAAKYTAEYAKKAGLDLVMNEPFKSGSADYSPILNRVKAADPDVFYVIGYSGDNIQIARQLHNLNIHPKLLMVVVAGDKRSDYGDFGNGVVQISEWSPEEKIPGLAAWVDQVRKDRPNLATITPAFIQGYAAMESLVQAIDAAKSLDRDAVLHALSTGTFDLPYGKIGYTPSLEGGLHQLVSDRNMILVQFRAQGEQVVYPTSKATGKLEYPAPGP